MMAGCFLPLAGSIWVTSSAWRILSCRRRSNWLVRTLLPLCQNRNSPGRGLQKLTGGQIFTCSGPLLIFFLNFPWQRRGRWGPTHKMKTTQWDEGVFRGQVWARVCRHPKCWLCAKQGHEAGASPEGGRTHSQGESIKHSTRDARSVSGQTENSTSTFLFCFPPLWVLS